MRTLMAGGMSLVLAGCVSPANDRMTIGQSLRLEAFSAPQPGAVAPEDRIETPSVTGIDRSHWEKTVLLVPVDGTVHHPTYARRVVAVDKTARQRGRFPTAETALELYGGSEEQQELGALLNQLNAAADLVLAVPRAIFVQRPWVRRMSPQLAYERYPHPERPQPEPALPPADPFAPPPPQRITP